MPGYARDEFRHPGLNQEPAEDESLPIASIQLIGWLVTEQIRMRDKYISELERRVTTAESQLAEAKAQDARA